jgi:hypothetical protein
LGARAHLLRFMRSVPFSCTFLLLLLLLLVLHVQALRFLAKLLRIQQPRALWAHAVFDWALHMFSLSSQKGSKIKQNHHHLVILDKHGDRPQTHRAPSRRPGRNSQKCEPQFYLFAWELWSEQSCNVFCMIRQRLGYDDAASFVRGFTLRNLAAISCTSASSFCNAVRDPFFFLIMS